MLREHQTCMHPFLPPAALLPPAAPAPLPQAGSALSLFAVVPLPAFSMSHACLPHWIEMGNHDGKTQTCDAGSDSQCL